MIKWIAMKVAKNVFQGVKDAHAHPPSAAAPGQIDVAAMLRRDIQKLAGDVKRLRRAVVLVVILQVALLLYQSLTH